ncbi:thiamine pyrophosphate-dependent enzyme [Roseisalinus antarcticus]|uniref:Acetolactate synthase isozyme 1 large subunit n=1 Tax=Roseisalinus antarcticus TaxID=254357 RepID=A0A1Y5T748_9RHOB|nr:thiamine pyrophosphate-dependent enzyme [Roseisalinus antarcticus]SLN57082.1 Acetolactate synthase isozyme 1 large subunit [Roseisalinus antarcticus]
MTTISNTERGAAKVMNRTDLTQRLVARLHKDEAVVGGIGHTNWDLWASGQRPQNFYMLGSMGLAAPIALGVAVAQPDRMVFALEGDGSLLMQVGALATIATVEPANLCVIVWDNEAFHITGGQKSLTATGADIVAMARGAGLTNSTWAADEAHFESLVDEALGGTTGPRLIAARIDMTKPAGTTDRDPVKIRLNFMSGIAPPDKEG